MVNVFLTGATGYLGSTLLMQIPPSWNITCFGRTRPSFSLPDNAEWIAGDLTLGRSDIPIPDDTDTIIHLAGIKGSGACRDRASVAIMSNIAGTHNLLEAAKERGIGRIIFASTYWVYGENIPIPFDERMQVAPTELYGLSKVVSEIEIQASGMDYQILRFANVFGMGSSIRPDEVVYYFIRAARSGDPIRLEHGGFQELDMIDVFDACSAIRAAAENHALPSGIINVGSGIPRSVRSIAYCVQDCFQKMYGIDVPILSDNADPAGASRRCVSVKKFKDSFPDIRLKPFEESVEMYIRQFEVSG